MMPCVAKNVIMFCLIMGMITIAFFCGLLEGGTQPLSKSPEYQQQRQQEDIVLESIEIETTDPVQLPVYDLDIKNGVLQKKAFSSKMRLVFLLGLEGTGHHYMADVLDHLCINNQVPCPTVCEMANAIYPQLANANTPSDYRNARSKIRSEMEELANYADGLSEEKGGAIASFGRCRSKVGMMSYPNFNGDDKPLQYVDFRVVAEEAERAGVDLRIIYLKRLARGLLISDTKHHSYGDTFMKEARILINNAAVVESTFQEVDLGYTTCLCFEDLADAGQASRVAEFISPTENVAEKVAHKMLAAFSSDSMGGARQKYSLNTHPQRSHAKFGTNPKGSRYQRAPSNLGASQLNEAEEVVAARLQQGLDRIERGQCSAGGLDAEKVELAEGEGRDGNEEGEDGVAAQVDGKKKKENTDGRSN